MVLEAYALWGNRCDRTFIGMFALAIWDRIEQRLLLIRDRVGAQAALFLSHDGVFAFASELRGLQPFRSWPRYLDPGALGEFFFSIWIYRRQPHNFLRAVRVIEPGNVAQLLDLRRLTHGPVLDARSRPHPRSTCRAMNAQPRSIWPGCWKARGRIAWYPDVPVGVFLSGGIDSSLVTAIIAWRLGATLRHTLIGFAEPAYDESQWP